MRQPVANNLYRRQTTVAAASLLLNRQPTPSPEVHSLPSTKLHRMLRLGITIQSSSQPHSLSNKSDSLIRATLNPRKRTAASSGLKAPFAILCFPARSRWLRVADIFTEPSFAASRLRHSSSVATWPSSSEKNLCRRTILIRSYA